jgi:hypothetical protein
MSSGGEKNLHQYARECVRQAEGVAESRPATELPRNRGTEGGIMNARGVI